MTRDIPPYCLVHKINQLTEADRHTWTHAAKKLIQDVRHPSSKGILTR